MSFEVAGFKNGVCTAAADLSAKQFYGVKITAALAVNVATVLGEAILGFLQNKPTNGQSAEVMVDGITKAVANGAIAAGSRLMITAAGRVDAIGATAGQKCVGWAIEAATAQDQIIAIQIVSSGGQI